MATTNPTRTYYWPACTVSGCGHRVIHSTEAELSATISEHRLVWVSNSGQAVCECHEDAAIARARQVSPFPCNGDHLGRFS